MQKKREIVLRKKRFFENVLEKNIYFEKNFGKKYFSQNYSSNFTKGGGIIQFFRVFKKKKA